MCGKWCRGSIPILFLSCLPLLWRLENLNPCTAIFPAAKRDEVTVLNKLKSTTRCVLSWYKGPLALNLPCLFWLAWLLRPGTAILLHWGNKLHASSAWLCEKTEQPGSCGPHWTTTPTPHSLPQDQLSLRNETLLLLFLAVESLPINTARHEGMDGAFWNKQSGQTYRGPGARLSWKWVVMI